MNLPLRLPYPGLRPFRRDEADLFFGRESAVDAMVERLASAHFLAVLGPSGSGKSSLVRTGLLDALELGLMAAAGSRWLIAELRPAGRPIENLARALIGLPREQGAASPADPDATQLATWLRAGPRSLIQWCKAGNLPERTNLLVLVDQFEELFRYADYSGREEAEAFVALLLESAASGGDPPIYVALTMRSEFLGPCALFPDLAERIDAGLYLTRRMTREEMREAIEGPAAICGFAIEPALVNRLLNDLASFAPWEGERGADQLQLLARRADQLPLMQHVLNRLWLRGRAASGGAAITLRLAAYEELGGLGGALNAHAEEVLASIPPECRPAAELVFRSLVSGASIATAVRRPCRFGELVALAAGNRPAVERVVEAFRDPDCNFLIVAPEGALADGSTIDISHESLIRQWAKLSEWLLAESQSAEEYRYLEETASRWQEGRAGLLKMPYLATALAWRARERPSEVWARRYGGNFGRALRFLEISGRRRRNLRRTSWAAAGLAAVAILIGAPWIAIQQMQLSRLQAATRADNLGTSYLTGQGMINGRGVTRDYSLAMAAFRDAAALGSLDAEYRIGYLYERGYGVKQDYAQAMAWYRRAAERGYTAAQFSMGYFFDEGYGVKRDYAQAMVWYRKAAALCLAGSDPSRAQPQNGAAGRCDAAAENNIGYLYAHGLGVQQDYHSAMTWYRNAADHGDASAAFNVGYLYEHARGVKQDYQEALEWYRRAADGGDAGGAFNVGYFFDNAIGVKRDYAEAMRWYRKAADLGDVAAENNIGYFYAHGLGVQKDYGEAMAWYRRAADGGSTNAAFNVGYFFEHGFGVKQDYTEAMTWYRKSADTGDASGAFRVGYFFENAYGVKQDYTQAMTWYKKAATLGDVDAENNIGYLYDNGLGVKQDYGQAMAWYRRAADAGSASAAYNIGGLFDKGHGVKQDDAQAIAWFQKDADKGDADGARRIGLILAREGKYDAALAAYQQSVKLANATLANNPNDADARAAVRSAAAGIGNISYTLLLQGAFQKALDMTELAIAAAPDLIWLQTNRADALMMLGQADAARAIYLGHKGLKDDGSGSGKSWNDDVISDFAALRRKGYSSPLMAEIEATFQN